MPAFEEAASKSRVPFGRVDGAAYSGLAQEFGIPGFPTVQRYINGKLKLTYSGDRTAQSLLQFAA
eukprot:CAMPEP_0175910462 /NCGR_PEP_ID=MMETSP0108-20121206/7683_1 /TAXON_ID=195067 ORGANISM="Goniomonas pacifica, Strain CCMP1869" /NCGR_SAMPLE_ID=MMETSP0108 /ASSEMBLY_ACC=CAM_ASM_000204 /LENGTH=64 /DNA_ID=CAMNT_0017232663 /DNA_START=41 /DNA_END=235 /DNA_ORIENTATION=-